MRAFGEWEKKAARCNVQHGSGAPTGGVLSNTLSAVQTFAHNSRIILYKDPWSDSQHVFIVSDLKIAADETLFVHQTRME